MTKSTYRNPDAVLDVNERPTNREMDWLIHPAHVRHVWLNRLSAYLGRLKPRYRTL